MGAELNKKKAAELYRRAKNTISFRTDLDAFRAQYGIPTIEATGKDAVNEWLHKKYLASIDAFYGDGKESDAKYLHDRIAFLRKYGFPVTMEGGAMDAILVDETPEYLMFEIDPPYSNEGRRAVYVAIYEGATRDELLDFIKQEWPKTIKSYLYGYGKNGRRVRERPKHQEDAEALKLWETLPRKKGYRQIQVARELGHTRDSDAVKQAVYREKKRRKNNT